MVLDMARPRYKENTTWLGMRGRHAARKSTPKVNILQVFTIEFSEIQVYRESQLAKCKEWDELAKEHHTYNLTQEEKRRYKGRWFLTLNKTGKNELVKLRSDYRAAVIMKNRLHHKSGEPIEEPIQPGQERRTRRGQEIFSDDYLSSVRVDQRTGWQYWPSSLSSSWWHESEWSWK